MSVFISQIAVVIEVIIVNMTIFHANIKPRYTTRFIIAVLSLFTCLILPLGILTTKLLGIYGNGNALFTLFGFFYLIPLHFLYEESMSKHFFIICFCWLYTLLVCSLSIQIGCILEPLERFCVTFLAATILFLFSYRYVLKFTKNIYLPLLRCKDPALRYYLNRASLVWFLTMLIINLNFVYEENHYLKIITILMVCANVLYNFELIRELLKQEKTIGNLEHQVTRDHLTQTGNRLGFKTMFADKIKREEAFGIIYLDLDDFKIINDTYGHTIGDLYLQEFAAGLKAIAGKNQVFRISGDEFAVFTAREKTAYLAEKMQKLNFYVGKNRIAFLGVSYGIVNYPEDGDDYRLLMDIADKKMYDMKKKKKSN